MVEAAQSFSESRSILVIHNGTGNLNLQSVSAQQPIQSASPINLAGRAARGELMWGDNKI